jgi:acetyl-CoA carboxylase biotin carboxyl carrier protein
MDLDAVEKLVDLVVSARVREVSVRDGALRVTVRKSARPPGTAAAPPHPASEAERVAPEPAETPAEPEAGPFITSPMVGIYHPATPAVQVGWSVKVGQVVGVIESMKLLSDVRADRAGIVKAVLVEQGMAVEYGQPLFELIGPEE